MTFFLNTLQPLFLSRPLMPSLAVAAASVGLASFALQGCGPKTTESEANIVGGQVVTAFNAQGPEYASTVAITSDSSVAWGKSYCSGTLVDAQRKLVVTAAHCFEDVAPGRHFIYFGTSVLGVRRGTLRRATAVVVHPSYDHALTVQRARYARPSHDIAVLKFEGSVPAGFAETKLAAASDTLPADLLLAGFGTTGALRTDSKTGRPLLDTYGMPLTQSDTGTLRRVEVGFAGLFAPGKVFDVAGKRGKPEGACPGDSGGPAYAKARLASGTQEWRVFGVLSTGLVGGADSNGDGKMDVGCVGKNTYTDVRAYRDFLVMATRRLSP